MPHHCHVAKDAQSTTATWAKPCQLNDEAVRDHFQIKKNLQGRFSIFFLQRRKLKLAQITVTKIIFKPC